MSKVKYAIVKTRELIDAGKIAVDIMIKTLKEDFEKEIVYDKKGDPAGKSVDLMKLKTFIEAKKIAFFNSKDFIKEIEQLEIQLESGDVDLEGKEYSENLLENSAENVK